MWEGEGEGGARTSFSEETRILLALHHREGVEIARMCESEPRACKIIKKKSFRFVQRRTKKMRCCAVMCDSPREIIQGKVIHGV